MSFGDWKICLEIGLNHCGDRDELDRLIVRALHMSKNFPVSVTVQIREPSFYLKEPELQLNSSDYLFIQQALRENNVPWGIAMGPVDNIVELFDKGLEPDFLKILSIATR